MCRLRGDARGAVLVEVALSLPILIMLLIGIIVYGAWLSAANAVQQAANEAARAAIAGINASERQMLAAESVTAHLVKLEREGRARRDGDAWVAERPA